MHSNHDLSRIVAAARARLVSLRDMLLWYRRSHRSFVVAGLALVGGVVSVLPFLPKATLLFVGMAALLLALLSFVWESSALGRRFSETELGERNPVFPGLFPHDDDLPDRFMTPFGTVLHDKRLDSSLRSHAAEWTAERRPGRYRLPEELADIAPFVLRRTAGDPSPFNGPCIRMAGDCRLDGSRTIPFEHAGFFDHLCSNELMRWRISMSYRDWDIRRHFLYDDDTRLTPLASSLLANIVGVSTLAVTTDHNVLLVEQSNANHVSRGLLAPSGSGSLEPKDLASDTALLEEIVLRGANRELIEETGLPEESISEGKLIGFGRWLERGGKPEFFSVTRLTETAQEIDRKLGRVSLAERRLVRKLRWVPWSELSVHDHERDANSSLPLAFAVHLLQQVLEQDKDFLSEGSAMA